MPLAKTEDAQTVNVESHLRTGEEYKQGMRDGRVVWYEGELIEDVTTHEVTGGLIDLHARFWDDQHAPETQDLITYVDEAGVRRSSGWLTPRTIEDLHRKRLYTEHLAYSTFGAPGRGPDTCHWLPIGMLAQIDTFERLVPGLAGNIDAYLRHASDNNIHVTAVIAEPQGMRSRGARAGEQRDAMLQIVRESDEGIWVSGARAAGSSAPQCDEVILGTIFHPHVRPAESIWAAVPVGTPGVSMICRETTGTARANVADHPISSRQEEIDSLVVFEEAFIPRERVFASGVPELQSPMLYGKLSQGEHWSVMTRLCVKAEILAGLAQMIVEALDTAGIPNVRDQVAQVIQYAKILRSGVIAAEQTAVPTNDVLMPDAATVTAVRAYALDNYAEIMHIVQELCGQGLVVRFNDSAFRDRSIGPKLERYLAQDHMSARRKNALMNIVWDITTGAQAGRTQLFEGVNGLPSYILRQKLFGETMSERKAMTARLAETFALDDTYGDA